MKLTRYVNVTLFILILLVPIPSIAEIRLPVAQIKRNAKILNRVLLPVFFVMEVNDLKNSLVDIHTDAVQWSGDKDILQNAYNLCMNTRERIVKNLDAVRESVSNECVLDEKGYLCSDEAGEKLRDICNRVEIAVSQCSQVINGGLKKKDKPKMVAETERDLKRASFCWHKAKPIAVREERLEQPNQVFEAPPTESRPRYEPVRSSPEFPRANSFQIKFIEEPGDH